MKCEVCRLLTSDFQLQTFEVAEMFITKLSLPRRTFLRGMGATIALPFLDAMAKAVAGRRAA